MEIPDENSEKAKADRSRGSWLAGALSIEYAPCSIAASELASTVHEIKHPTNQYDDIIVFIENKKPEDSLTLKHKNDLAGDGYAHRIVALPLNVPSTQLCSTIPMKDAELTEFMEYNEISKKWVYDIFPFSLVQNISGTETTHIRIEEIKKKRRRTKKVPTKVIEFTYTPGDIWLADRVAGGKVLLPIATFEKRIDGTCSYVQLGQEITDDSVFALQSDEENRLKLIDDLRKLVTPTNARSELTETVRHFAKQERERNAEYLVVALGAWVSEILQEKIASLGEIHHNAIIETDEEVLYQDEVKKVVLGYSNEKNEVAIGPLFVSFEASQPIEEQKDNAPITVSFVARGHVAFPVAQFFPETGEVQLIGVDHLNAADKYKCMLAIVAIIDENDESEFAETIENTEITPRHFLLTTLGLSQRIDQRLMPSNEEQEDLVWAIGVKALGVRYSGTVNNVNLDVTHGSVIGHVELRHVNGSFEAHISAKPAKLHGMPISEIDTFVYDPTKPLTDKFPKGEDAKEFVMLIKGFNNPDLTS